MSKKVLIIQQIIPEYRLDFFELLKKELAKNEIELSLIYGNTISPNKSGGNFYELPWGKLIENKTLNFCNITLCWQPVTGYLKDKDLIIVEGANKLLLNYFIIIARHFWKNKLGFWGHGRNLQKPSQNWRNQFSRFFLNRCNWWFAYTKEVKKFLIKNNYPEDKITVVQNAIDTLILQRQFSEINDQETNKLKTQLGIHPHSKIAIFCGGMYAEKRIDFILQACLVIKKEIPEFEMIFIGAGSEVTMLKKTSETHTWIHYVGSKTGKERVKYFKIASVQLMPGLVGLGILDSFALQTPIITTSYPYHSPEIEYLENWKNGVMTENSLEIYSQTVINILKNDLHQDLITGCINSAKKYSLEKMVENFKGGITECLNRTK